MSHEKVKSIKIDEENKKVFINCATNNCRPLSYTREEYPYFSKILQEEGREAVEIALLKTYEGGSFQGGINKYSNAFKVLYYIFREEYNKFSWRNDNGKWGSEESKRFDELRESKEFEELLKKALNYKIPKKKFVIAQNHYGDEVIYGKRCLSCMKWLHTSEKATKYYFKEEAEDYIYDEFKDVWKVVEVEG